ncbi:glycoside hydrolase family 68 protein [Nonomuraea gerenzanensis]|uniref:Levansucrase n=1 Tax=Nonomuraea gerenzanensis TaxID=93944 RepID=A0A1M4EBC0_9ACTN|nr:glycoside hydrolase family 68 protein [Nonomuraea gerenzanensis]UBU18415.1 glycoside hydrolase family 68 protein [Nonomuraea gerenzanensis]SBO96247.1 Levansucrase [Nonomuraea gerenzanensis]
MSGDRPARWTHRHLGLLAESAATTAPLIDPTALPRILPGHHLWDLWPVQDEDGSTSVAGGRELWMALSAPDRGHPEERHDHARIRLLGKKGNEWTDLGDAFPDGASPGSREWSGSAIRRPDGTVSVYYTAAGRRGESPPTYRQSVVEARTTVIADGDRVTLRPDAPHREILRSDERTYLPADGVPGNLRAFRDPGWFRDPADGVDRLLVAASTPWQDTFTGAIALAEPRDGAWSLLPPLLVAEGVNHEIERPHVIVHDSRYHLFFCTHRHSFDPAHPAPTGLYGFAAPALAGPYEPLNGSGLVIGNPAGRPDQAYAWLVLPDLHVVSFANYRSPQGVDLRHAPAAQARAGFGGTVAPTLKLTLDGLSTSVVPVPEDLRGTPTGP